MRQIVCVDLDGVLASWKDGWKGVDHFGDPIPGAVEFTKKLAETYDVVIYTCRCSEGINGREKACLLSNRVREWLDTHGFTYHDIYVGQGKPVAAAYIDDRAVACRPEASTDSVWEFEHALAVVYMMCNEQPIT